MDDFAESFVGHQIFGVADLFSGYDACTLAKGSQDLTTFQCLEFSQRLTVLPQGCTNSVQEFQRQMEHVLAPHWQVACVFIDDIDIKGPKSDYEGATLADNPEIQLFVYEYTQNLDCVFQTFIVAGVTASGTKLVFATPRVKIVGSIVSKDGWHLVHGIATKVLNWATPWNISNV
jgi:hypothetical protein